MKKTLLTLTAALGLTISATTGQARLGWTLDQCRQKYGTEKKIARSADLNLPVYIFETPYFKIITWMMDGKVVYIDYVALPEWTPTGLFNFYTQDVIDAIVRKNVGDQKLIEKGTGIAGSLRYETKDRTIIYISPPKNIQSQLEPQPNYDFSDINASNAAKNAAINRVAIERYQARKAQRDCESSVRQAEETMWQAAKMPNTDGALALVTLNWRFSGPTTDNPYAPTAPVYSSAQILPITIAGWHVAGTGAFFGTPNPYWGPGTDTDLVLENPTTGQHVIWVLNRAKTGLAAGYVLNPTVPPSSGWRAVNH